MVLPSTGIFILCITAGGTMKSRKLAHVLQTGLDDSLQTARKLVQRCSASKRPLSSMRPALLRSCLRSACTSSGLQNAPASMLHRCRQQLGWRAAAATAAQQQQQLSLAAARPLHGWGCQHRCQQDPRLASSPQQQLLLQRQQPASRRFAAAAARGGGLDSLSASTDVGTAIRTAVAAAGRTVGAADEALINALVDNWYHTAGDVAAMSQVRHSVCLPQRVACCTPALVRACLDSVLRCAPRRMSWRCCACQ